MFLRLGGCGGQSPPLTLSKLLGWVGSFWILLSLQIKFSLAPAEYLGNS